MNSTLRIFLRRLAMLAVAHLAVEASAQQWTADNSFDPAIESGVGLSGVVYAVPSPGSKLLVNTSFNYVGGVNATGRIVRLNPDGTTDSTFRSPPPDPNEISSTATYALLAYPDGRVLIAVGYDSTSRIYVRRLNADGTRDYSFAQTSLDTNYVRAKLLNDGRILVYASNAYVDAINRTLISLVGANGGLVPGMQSPFPTSSFPILNEVAVTSDGQKLLVGGNFSISGVFRAVARLNFDGTLDATFDLAASGITQPVSMVYPLPGGAILAVSSDGVVRLSASGAKDPTFVSPNLASGTTFGPQQADGKIFFATTVTGTFSTRELRRMNLDGTTDATFVAPSTPYGASYQIGLPLIGDDGALYVGPLTSTREDARLMLSRLSPTGAFDPTFNPRFGRPATVSSYTRQSDGKHLVAGFFSYTSGTPQPAVVDLVRLNSDGTTDSGFTASVTGDVDGLIALPSGKILVNGFFSGSSLIRLNPNGSKDSTFLSPTFSPRGFSVFGNSIAVDSTGNIYGLASAGGTALARCFPDGQMDASFQTSADMGQVAFFVPLLDGSILVGRNNSAGGPSVIRLLHNGSVDPNFPRVSVGNALVGLVGLADGSALSIWRNSTPGGSFFVLKNIRPDGTSSFSFTSAVSAGTGFISTEVKLAIAAQVISLMRQASAGVVSTLELDLLASNISERISCRSDGQVILVQNISGFGAYWSKYQASGLPTVEAPIPGHLVNLSVRTGAGTGDKTLIVGVVIGGAGTSGTKPVLIRAIGPTLTQYGVTGALADPSFDFIRQGSATPIATNDNWAGDAQVKIVANTVGAFALPDDATKDAAAFLTPEAGPYSVKITGKAGTTGVTLAEIYDASGSGFNLSTPRLVNVSARAEVGTGEAALIAGFVIDGATPRTVLVRAVGPTLSTYGVIGTLADPQLEITQTVNGATVTVATNDNWAGNAQVASTAVTVGAFDLSSASSKDAAILVTLPPGVYSAKVTGVGNTTGIALIEVYEVP
jgi:uncharacterized delta-60 repeat protein